MARFGDVSLCSCSSSSLSSWCSFSPSRPGSSDLDLDHLRDVDLLPPAKEQRMKLKTLIWQKYESIHRPNRRLIPVCLCLWTCSDSIKSSSWGGFDDSFSQRYRWIKAARLTPGQQLCEPLDCGCWRRLVPRSGPSIGLSELIWPRAGAAQLFVVIHRS